MRRSRRTRCAIYKFCRLSQRISLMTDGEQLVIELSGKVKKDVVCEIL